MYQYLPMPRDSPNGKNVKAYADDIVILEDTENVVVKATEWTLLSMRTKPKLPMVMSRRAVSKTATLKVGPYSFEQVDEFKYIKVINT